MIDHNGFWIEWLYLLITSATNTLNYNPLQQLTISDCLSLSPFFTGLRLSFLLLWLTWFWFTNYSILLRMTYESVRTNDEWITNPFFSARLLISSPATMENVCCLSVDMRTPSVSSWSKETCFKIIVTLWFPQAYLLLRKRF